MEAPPQRRLAVSRFGEYFIAADRSITFKRRGAAPEKLTAASRSDADIYWACVEHDKMLFRSTSKV